jgi:AraC family transcriptional regulator, regulatory protein of adaptative response / methylated-DNA-[protein]-cysteine methyltransferase
MEFGQYVDFDYQQVNRNASQPHPPVYDIYNGELDSSAQVAQGISTASGFWEAFNKVVDAPSSRSENNHCLLARWIDTPLGGMLALADDEGLHLLEFADRHNLEVEILKLRKHLLCNIIPGEHIFLHRIAVELADYFDGINFTFSVPLVAFGSVFEHSVWALLKRIPPGETWSYAQMAEKLGQPAANRAVGHANGKNSLAIVIPCHRVIRADGSLSGYGGGVWRKRWLLEHEQKFLNKNHQPSLL